MITNYKMNWIFSNRNALVIMSNIIGKKPFKFYQNYHKVVKDGVSKDLPSDECFFCTKDIKTKPSMTESQIKTALKNLVSHGFIEIIDYDCYAKPAGLKRIKIIINPFDKDILKIFDHNKPDGYPTFS